MCRIIITFLQSQASSAVGAVDGLLSSTTAAQISAPMITETETLTLGCIVGTLLPLPVLPLPE